MDTLRLDVTRSVSLGEFQVEVWVNGKELTAAGAGVGMDPYDVLVPTNRFVAPDRPTRVPVARCGCGEYDCGSTDATITRTDRTVRWEWHGQAPMDRAVEFDAVAYDEEVHRATSDHSWETPMRTVGRLVRTATADGDLPAGLRFDWIAEGPRDQAALLVCLRHEDRHQIALRFELGTLTPEELAAQIRHVLVDVPPAAWDAAWSSIQRSGTPPPMAGPRWRNDINL